MNSTRARDLSAIVLATVITVAVCRMLAVELRPRPQTPRPIATPTPTQTPHPTPDAHARLDRGAGRHPDRLQRARHARRCGGGRRRPDSAERRRQLRPAGYRERDARPRLRLDRRRHDRDAAADRDRATRRRRRGHPPRLPPMGYACGASEDFGANVCQLVGDAPDTEEMIVAREGVWDLRWTSNRNGCSVPLRHRGSSRRSMSGNVRPRDPPRAAAPA